MLWALAIGGLFDLRILDIADLTAEGSFPLEPTLLLSASPMAFPFYAQVCFGLFAAV